VVIADEGRSVSRPMPRMSFTFPGEPHLAPILNTLVGHIWGYHAALAINDGSRFLYDGQGRVHSTL
jgi:glucosamine--fructose-6-phosphate aminotransferase (isomerizing)